jgi:hypothetical protein
MASSSSRTAETIRAGAGERGRRPRLGSGRTPHGDGGRAEVAVEHDLDRRPREHVAPDAALEWRQRQSFVRRGPVRAGGSPAGPGLDLLVEARAGRHCVDQPPVDGLLALDALDPGGEHVGQIAPDVALVHDPGEAPGAGQHGEERHLRERHRRGPVVDQDDLVAGQGQLVAAAGRRAVDRGDPGLAGMGRGVLDAVAGLVGELAEVDLVAVGGGRQHLDVGAGAEHLVHATGHHHCLDAGMLEAQPLDGVVQLDVHGQVVAVELQLVVGAQAGVRGHLQGQGGDVTVDGEGPMAVEIRAGVEADDEGIRRRSHRCSVLLDATGLGGKRDRCHTTLWSGYVKRV